MLNKNHKCVEIHKLFNAILNQSEFIGHTFFVGGCVRDYLRDIAAKDIDIVVDMKDGAYNLAYYIYNYFSSSVVVNYYRHLLLNLINWDIIQFIQLRLKIILN